MRYQTRQVLELADITGDTLRHWKKQLPPISTVDGRSGQYTPSQLVCICAIASAVSGLGVPISRFSVEAEFVFDTVERYTTDRRRNLSLMVSPTRISFINDDDHVEEETYAVVRLNPIWDRLQNALLEADPEDVSQAALPFGRAS
jgi:hypothetical protein